MSSRVGNEMDVDSSESVEDLSEVVGMFYVSKCASHPRARDRSSSPLGCFVPDESESSSSKNSGSRPREDDRIIGLVPPKPTKLSGYSSYYSYRWNSSSSPLGRKSLDSPSEYQRRAQSAHQEARCDCFDPSCRLRTYYMSQKKLIEQKAEDLQNIDCWKHPYLQLHAAHGEDLLKAHAALLKRSGGLSSASLVYEMCSMGFHEMPEKVLSTKASAECETVLIKLLNRLSVTAAYEQLLLSQIAAFIRIYLEHEPDLLFVRNADGYSALDVAGFTDKPEAAVYLALLHPLLGRDVNQSLALYGGNTVLHLLARKGDDCANALEALLSIKTIGRDGRPKRLLRYDVVNEEGKTPLDVAVACSCSDLYSTGRNRAVYKRIIDLFVDCVNEDAENMLRAGEEQPENGAEGGQPRSSMRNSQKVQLTYVNF